MKTLDAQLQSGDISNVQLVYGDEDYMLRYYKNKIKSKLSNPDDDMNYSYFEGDKLSVEEISSIGSTLPFFADNRLIVVENSTMFKKANEMSEVIGEFPDTTYVLFVQKSKEVDKRSKLYKYINKNGCVTECPLWGEPELVRWATDYMKKNGKKMSGASASYLISKSGFMMGVLANQMDKLISYAADKDTITNEDIDTMVVTTPESQIFQMIDYAVAHKKNEAMKLYGALVQNKEPAALILSLLGRHLNILIRMKELDNGRYNDRDVAGKLKVPFFTVKKYRAQARSFSQKALFELLNERAKAEENFKNGRISETLATETFLIKILTKV